MRFDELELEPVPLIEDPIAADVEDVATAPRFKRLLALLTDLYDALEVR